MNFFEYQDQARRRTKVLIVYYVLAVILIIVAIYGAALLLLSLTSDPKSSASHMAVALWMPDLFVIVAGFTGLIIIAGTSYKVLSLSGGGRSVAIMLGGRQVTGSPENPAEQRFVNVVEEMAIASGIPVPDMFILDDEPGINAFAAGFSTRDAVVAVTRGALDRLNRDELQGVIGHEFSHIFNGDMRLNVKLMGVLHGILLISLVGYWVMRLAPRSSGKRDKGGGVAFAMIAGGAALYAIGSIGVFFGNLIKSAVSRQREFLADASSAQFTRNPAGLAGALATIGGMKDASSIQHPSSQQASHFFFADGFPHLFSSLFATHPPIEERIQRLDPTWIESHARSSDATPKPQTDAVSSEALLGFVGQPTNAHIKAANTLIGQIPSVVQSTFRDPTTSEAVAYGLLLAAAEPAVRNRQLQHLRQNTPTPTFGALNLVLQNILQLTRSQRIPILDLAIPALRQMRLERYKKFRENILHIVAVDQEVDIYEFVVMRTLLRTLDRHFRLLPPPPTAGLLRRDGCRPHVECLLATLAWLGSNDEPLAQKAFTAGMQCIFSNSMPELSHEPPTLDALESAMDALEGTTHELRAEILAACAACISADGVLTFHEAELFRAVSSSLECPMPPLAVTSGLC